MTKYIRQGDAVDLDIFHTSKLSNTTCGDNDDENSVLESQDPVNRDQDDWANRDYKIHWYDVIVSAGDSNIIRKYKSTQYTKLVSVVDGDTAGNFHTEYHDGPALEDGIPLQTHREPPQVQERNGRYSCEMLREGGAQLSHWDGRYR